MSSLRDSRPTMRANDVPTDDFRESALLAWRLSDPVAKCAATRALWAAAQPVLPMTDLNADTSPTKPFDLTVSTSDGLEAGRPATPALVEPSKLTRRRIGNAVGRAAMLHSIAHIEFNAINLALDAVWRYPQMGPTFVADWLSVAADEARHFELLTTQMAFSDVRYGDFNAHAGLWDMARKTAHDLLARMALVPRVLEARGLDATPVIQKKLEHHNDHQAVAVLQTILDEEIRHVRLGDYWFRLLCLQRGVEPERQFQQLIRQFDAPMPNGPINASARLAAGFSSAELTWLADRKG